ncbi:MAG: hypothetical protein LKJ17_09825 [Oscillospiraceae bacterium]|jgi:hypothetical protein|nr:hypothetical protein [Oscillospiraceae bacterium]
MMASLDSVALNTVDASRPRRAGENLYTIRYRIVKEQPQVCRNIVRVELYANGSLVELKTEGRLEQGCFQFDVNRYPQLLGTDLALHVCAWDDIFNCVSSIERFIIEESCEQ